MYCYRDMTFCPFHSDCIKAADCPRAFTDEHKQRAGDMPVSLLAFRPICHVTAQDFADAATEYEDD